jgi:hypothetical protein
LCEKCRNATWAAPQTEKDAARYRWLREHTVATGLSRFTQSYRKQFLDEAVDAASTPPSEPT